MTLLRRTAFVVFQDLVDDADEWIQLRPLRRSAAAITRWNREQQHLGNRPGINAKAPSHLPIAQTFPLDCKAHPSIKLHDLHPPPSAPRAKSYLPPDFYSGATGQPVASVREFRSGAYSDGQIEMAAFLQDIARRQV